MDFKNGTHEGITHLALSELHTCHSYFQRLYYAVIELSDVEQTSSIRSWSSTFCYQTKLLINKSWVKRNREEKSNVVVDTLSLREARDFTKQIFKLFESILILDIMEKELLCDELSETLNFLFLHARRLHLIVNESTNLQIDLPRVSLMDTISTTEEVPAYRVTADSIFDFSTDSHAPVRSIQTQREKKYDELIQKGHSWIAKKEHDMARQSFFRALNFNETAEAYNLIGWTYSLESNFEVAKKFCLKAIKTDPAYGAPYNDLGSYLLSEGETKESLKWFELAKNSRNYQNREYPYINAGRAQMNLRNYKLALKEFGMALTLAPHNEELHLTVTRLKETLNKSDLFTQAQDSAPPSLFD
jgi:Tfp pilus assembly protein PilF